MLYLTEAREHLRRHQQVYHGHVWDQHPHRTAIGPASATRVAIFLIVISTRRFFGCLHTYLFHIVTVNHCHVALNAALFCICQAFIGIRRFFRVWGIHVHV